MTEVVTFVVWVCASLATVWGAVSLVTKAIVKKIKEEKLDDEGIKCLLRSDLLRIYYDNLSTKTIRQYEYENFQLMYAAYKARRGNSFIDHIKVEVDEWEVVIHK